MENPVASVVSDAYLFVSLLQLPVASSQRYCLQGFLCAGQGAGHVPFGLHTPDWHVPPGPAAGEGRSSTISVMLSLTDRRKRRGVAASRLCTDRLHSASC
jgi:hypothetical protein